jgi:glycosyltransferase involved in cell wall biosynthesis
MDFMKPQIAIITHSFLDPKNPEGLNIGGVETWILELVRLLSEIGFTPVVYQPAEIDFTLTLEGAEVIGHGGGNSRRMTRLSHKDIDRRKIRWIIYASSFAGEKNFRPGQIFIQHGIHWDYTTSKKNLLSRLKWEYVRRTLSRNDLQRCRKSRLTITVDTNFLNYARIMLGHRFNPNKIYYIPNFAALQEPAKWQEKWLSPKEINIVFTRRFEHRRGVTIFAEALEKILASASNIRVTFAGCGSLEHHLIEKFGKNDRIKILEVPHEKIYDLLNKSHIAIIPSVFSEGTSLSCLEAMASGCAVIATDVGGLCNLVLPDYNGLLIRPVASEIASAIINLSNDVDKAETFARHGYDMILHSFQPSLWRKRIQQALGDAGILDEVSDKKA